MPESPTGQPYPEVPAKPSFPDIERGVLGYWAENDVFRRSVDQREAGENGANEFVFYDGPPFANGLPHYGHLLTSYAKDVVPRYQTMKGRRVERRFGWDTHGLPAEMEAEKELDVSGRQQIKAFGIDKFNDHCRSSVLKYTNEWERYVTRMARWVDFQNDYKTMDLSYMESVMWAFKQLWDKGLIYEGLRVMPYSWACETPLSNFEIRLDDATRPKQDPAVTVMLSLTPEDGDPGPMKLLIWTTTPWTLPSNLAVAVGPDIDYALMQEDGTVYVIGDATTGKYEAQLKNATKIGTIKGSALVGRTYEPLFPYFADTENAFQVLGADFVDTEDGTGVVHMAPGFGEEDQKVCEAHGIPLVVPVDESGRFTADVSDYEGQNVFDANKPIIKRLKDEGVLIKHETYEHNYPHCWRTDTPIIYKALSSWYVRVTDFRDRMVELNQEINWIPEHIRDGQFGKWLEGARDWSISRNRFWGTPIPIWKSDDPAYPRLDCYGSLEELERDFGVKLDDLHRPGIDALVRPNPDDPTGKSMMRRVPEVLDCWFESGSMPFAQIHYPFENREWFEHHFPADYIVEYVAQTRGWFYTLMVLATALFDCPPFRNCICHGILGGADGRKLSKRLKNYLDPEIAFDRYGADALRWMLMSSPLLRGLDLKIEEDGRDIAEVIRLVINPIWNAYYFFALYANADGIVAEVRTDSDDVLDRYVLAKTRELVENVTERMDDYDLSGASAHVTAFIDALNNWYIRRSRGRFWGAEDTADKRNAYDTLLTVLTVLCRSTAPLLPLISEEIYRGLTGDDSVHLSDWPSPDELPADPELVRDMDRVREVCSVGHAIREDNGRRARQPLAMLTIVGTWAENLAPFEDLLRAELNVKAVTFEPSLEGHGEFVLRPNGRALGPRLGKAMKTVMAAARDGEWTRSDDGTITVAGETLAPDEYDLKLAPHESEGAQAVATNDAIVLLDLALTPELEREGLARDVVRLIQKTRKDFDFQVTDRIELTLTGNEDVVEAVRAHEAYVRDQVLAVDVQYAARDAGEDHKMAGRVDGKQVAVGIRVSGG